MISVYCTCKVEEEPHTLDDQPARIETIAPIKSRQQRQAPAVESVGIPQPKQTAAAKLTTRHLLNPKHRKPQGTQAKPHGLHDKEKERKQIEAKELNAKVRELKELQILIDEAEAEAEAIRDELKAHMTAQGTEEITVDVFKVRYQTVSSSLFDSTGFNVK